MDVSVAIIGHKHLKYLPDLFASIYRNPIKRTTQVVFVDNNSCDGSVEFVEKNYPDVKIIQNKEAYNFAKNNNIAFRGSSGDFFLMLNPDTEIREGSIDKMVDFLEQSTDAGACGPKLIFPDGNIQLSCRRFPTLRSFLFRRTPLRYLFQDSMRDKIHLMTDFGHDETTQVDWLLGACIMVRRSVYEELGGMDELFEMYCEDIDFCKRLNKKGYKVYYYPEAEIIHHHLAETDKTFFTKKTWLHLKSMVHYLTKHWI